jgi:ribosomal protein L40E
MNSYSTQAMGSATETIGMSSTDWIGTDTVGGSGPYCWYDDFPLGNLASGTVVTGTIGPPSTVIDLFLFTREQYSAIQDSGCGNIPYVAVAQVHGLDSAYTLNVVIPAADSYYLVVFCEHARTSFTVPVTLVVVANQEVTSPVYYVVTYEETQPMTYVTNLQVTQPSGSAIQTAQGLGSYSIFEIAVVGAILVFIVAGLLYYLRKGGEEPTRNRKAKRPNEKPIATTLPITPRTRTVTEPKKVSPEKQFCLECGNELPLGSKFCNKCGSKQA